MFCSLLQMFKWIGASVLVGKAAASQLCINYDLENGSRIEIGTSSYTADHPRDLFGYLSGCRLFFGTYEQCYTAWADDVAARSSGGSDCSTCIKDFFSTGPNAAGVDTCINTCVVSSCTDSCDRLHLNQIASECGLVEPFDITTTTAEPSSTSTEAAGTTTEKEVTTASRGVALSPLAAAMLAAAVALIQTE